MAISSMTQEKGEVKWAFSMTRLITFTATYTKYDTQIEVLAPMCEIDKRPMARGQHVHHDQASSDVEKSFHYSKSKHIKSDSAHVLPPTRLIAYNHSFLGLKTLPVDNEESACCSGEKATMMTKPGSHSFCSTILEIKPATSSMVWSKYHQVMPPALDGAG